MGLDRMAPPDPGAGAALVHWGAAQFRGEPAAVSRRPRGVGLLERARPAAGADVCVSCRTRSRAVAAALRAHGIVPGDRVAGFLPNMPEAVIAMLATASLGADLVVVLARLRRQGCARPVRPDRPRVLFCADGYRYAGKADRLAGPGARDRERIPEIERVVVVPYLRRSTGAVGHSRAQCCGPIGSGAAGADRGKAGSLASALRRSTIRSTSCTPPARRACRSAWSMARAARCSST